MDLKCGRDILPSLCGPSTRLEVVLVKVVNIAVLQLLQ